MWGGKQLFAFIGGGAAGAAQSLTGAATIHTFTIPFRCTPIRCGFTITTAVTTWASTVTFGAAGICGILTIPTTATANKAYYEDTDYVAAGTGVWTNSLAEGAQVAVVVSIPLGAPGTGAGIPWLLVEVNPEQPGNNSAMVAG